MGLSTYQGSYDIIDMIAPAHLGLTCIDQSRAQINSNERVRSVREAFAL